MRPGVIVHMRQGGVSWLIDNYGITPEKLHPANFAFTCQHDYTREQFLIVLKSGSFRNGS